MGKVAAIQMTSSHVVAENLASAEHWLREAKDAGALIACLPENFSFIGLQDADNGAARFAPTKPARTALSLVGRG